MPRRDPGYSASQPAAAYHASWEAADMGSSDWVPDTHVGDLSRGPGSWLETGPALAGGDILEIEPAMEDHTLSVSVFLYLLNKTKTKMYR